MSAATKAKERKEMKANMSAEEKQQRLLEVLGVTGNIAVTVRSIQRLCLFGRSFANSRLHNILQR